jgi:hypothetical protein
MPFHPFTRSALAISIVALRPFTPSWHAPPRQHVPPHYTPPSRLCAARRRRAQPIYLMHAEMYTDVLTYAEVRSCAALGGHAQSGVRPSHRHVWQDVGGRCAVSAAQSCQCRGVSSRLLRCAAQHVGMDPPGYEQGVDACCCSPVSSSSSSQTSVYAASHTRRQLSALCGSAGSDVAHSLAAEVAGNARSPRQAAEQQLQP